ncbi:MAG TPA: Spy/CpxP family protein refolding chaperone [Gammaproteobacteria bacterium]
MKHAMKVTLAVLGLAASVALIGACSAHYRGAEAQAGHIERLSERLADDLALNEVQRSHLDTLRTTLQSVTREMHDARDSSRATLLDLLQQPTIDRSRALALVQERTQEVAERAPTVVVAFADFYDSLDVKQQAELRARIEKRWQRRDRCWK